MVGDGSGLIIPFIKRQKPDASVGFTFVIRLEHVAGNVGCRNEPKMVNVDSNTSMTGNSDYVTDHAYELTSNDTHLLTFETGVFLGTEILVCLISIKPSYEILHLLVGDNNGDAGHVQPAIGIGLSVVEMMEEGKFCTAYEFLHLVNGAVNEQYVLHSIDEFLLA